MFGAAALATACDYKASAAPRVVTTVRLTLADDTIEVGQSTEITATALDQYGDSIADIPATYASASPEVADVSPTLGVILESIFPLGLNAADAVHLFNRIGVQVDSFSWLANPATSFGRCPDGSGDFVTTTASSRGFSNVCAAAGP